MGCYNVNSRALSRDLDENKQKINNVAELRPLLNSKIKQLYHRENVMNNSIEIRYFYYDRVF